MSVGMLPRITLPKGIGSRIAARLASLCAAPEEKEGDEQPNLAAAMKKRRRARTSELEL